MFDSWGMDGRWMDGTWTWTWTWPSPPPTSPQPPKIHSEAANQFVQQQQQQQQQQQPNQQIASTTCRKSNDVPPTAETKQKEMERKSHDHLSTLKVWSCGAEELWSCGAVELLARPHSRLSVFLVSSCCWWLVGGMRFMVRPGSHRYPHRNPWPANLVCVRVTPIPDLWQIAGGSPGPGPPPPPPPLATPINRKIYCHVGSSLQLAAWSWEPPWSWSWSSSSISISSST